MKWIIIFSVLISQCFSIQFHNTFNAYTEASVILEGTNYTIKQGIIEDAVAFGSFNNSLSESGMFVGASY